MPPNSHESKSMPGWPHRVFAKSGVRCIIVACSAPDDSFLLSCAPTMLAPTGLARTPVNWLRTSPGSSRHKAHVTVHHARGTTCTGAAREGHSACYGIEIGSTVAKQTSCTAMRRCNAHHGRQLQRVSPNLYQQRAFPTHCRCGRPNIQAGHNQSHHDML